MFYEQTSPVILTDDLFVSHGGQTGTSTAAQRQIAYLTAEFLVQDYINTFLTITTVTGTFRPESPILLGHSYVTDVNSVVFYSKDRNSSCTFTTDDGCAYLKNARVGLVDVNYQGSCRCATFTVVPWQVEISYDAGLPSGTVYNSPIITALALLANEELSEVLGESATPGGVGIIEWENQEYREKRLGLKRTAFGSTSVANRVARLLNRYKVIRYAGL